MGSVHKKKLFMKTAENERERRKTIVWEYVCILDLQSYCIYGNEVYFHREYSFSKAAVQLI